MPILVRGKLVHRALKPCFRETRGEFRLLQQSRQSDRELLRVADWNEKSRLVVKHDFRVASGIRRYDRQFGSHRFEQYVRGTLAERRQREYIGSRIEGA